jgi:hypothetical protein
MWKYDEEDEEILSLDELTDREGKGMIRIFYHDDLDGKCAAYIAGTQLRPATQREIMFRPINYDMEFPFDEISSEDTVYMLDFSLDADEMRRVFGLCNGKFVWIDHHKSAIEKMGKCLIPGLRKIGLGGCELTWQYFVPTEPVPEFLALVGDWDTWTFRYGDDTRFFHYGIQTEDTDPLSDGWPSAEADARMYIDRGRIVKGYKSRTDEAYIRDYGFWVDWRGRKCYAVSGLFNSEPFEAVVPEADIWMPFRYGHGQWTVSLFSKTVDVSVIAESCGGGGHEGAAGFQCDYPPFLPFAKAYASMREAIDCEMRSLEADIGSGTLKVFRNKTGQPVYKGALVQEGETDVVRDEEAG